MKGYTPRGYPKLKGKGIYDKTRGKLGSFDEPVFFNSGDKKYLCDTCVKTPEKCNINWKREVCKDYDRQKNMDKATKKVAGKNLSKAKRKSNSKA